MRKQTVSCQPLLCCSLIFSLFRFTLSSLVRVSMCRQHLIPPLSVVHFVIFSYRRLKTIDPLDYQPIHTEWKRQFSLMFVVYYRPQRSCGQGYVFTRVCDSVHRGGGSPGRETPPDQADTPLDQADTPPGSRLQNTVYERPVRILLECILVLWSFFLWLAWIGSDD